MAEIAPSTVVLQVSDLAVEFPTRQRNRTVKAVNGVSFDVYAGETFGVIGESGSGKTTLGRALVSLIAPTRGRLLLGGVDPATLGKAALRKHRRDFQIMFQDPNAALNPRMRIIDSVMEPLEVAGHRDRAMNRTSALQAMARVGLPAEFAQRYPHQLSGGQKQRVIIARTLTLRPRLIVCDEVVAALDVSIRGEVLNLFADLQREFGLAYVFITHDLSVVSHISDRIAVMYLGCLMELGPADALAEHPLHPYTQALLSAEPIPMPPSMRRQEPIELKGEIPSPVDPPSGCAFRTRCAFATEICAAVRPVWEEHLPGHWVACHHPLARTLDR
ncbi:MAG: ATP-binding cassette domain-containing protein [Proteobacteria bacterium]|nr:ATP-binding cassette domain-containing protein [Pseudomonadota bacterium]